MTYFYTLTLLYARSAIHFHNIGHVSSQIKNDKSEMYFTIFICTYDVITQNSISFFLDVRYHTGNEQLYDALSSHLLV